MKGHIVMYGSHGGELDRIPFNETNLKELFTKLIEETVIDPGDKFVIEAKE